MTEMYLTAYNGSILGPIAKGLGWIMDKIYVLLDSLGFGSIALTIVIFTIFIYLCLFPLTYQQQKFSVLSRKMQPELKAVQDKYKGKRDNESMQAQQEETQVIYDKYGISPTGSCVQLLIQMPILFALYRVFYNVPAYISSVKNVFGDLVNGIMATDGWQDTMQSVYDGAKLSNVSVDFTATDSTTLGNYIIDVLYKLSDDGWNTLTQSFSGLSDLISSTHSALADINYLFILNISDTPWNLIKTGFSGHNWLLLIAALLVPVASYASQMCNLKLTPQNTDGNDQMAMQMKTMNMMMPIMSLIIAFTVPVGLVLYWIVGSIVRIVQQICLNKHFEKIDLEDIIEKNKEKAAAKAEKRGERRAQIYNAATMSTKQTMSDKAKVNTSNKEALERAEKLRSSAPAGSMAAKANKVKEFNERNNK